jgi:hypothetical protein
MHIEKKVKIMNCVSCSTLKVKVHLSVFLMPSAFFFMFNNIIFISQISNEEMAHSVTLYFLFRVQL